MTVTDSDVMIHAGLWPFFDLIWPFIAVYFWKRHLLYTMYHLTVSFIHHLSQSPWPIFESSSLQNSQCLIISKKVPMWFCLVLCNFSTFCKTSNYLLLSSTIVVR